MIRYCPLFAAGLILAGCGAASPAPATSAAPVADPASTAADTAGLGRSLPYTGADSLFMSGMIGHHSQAIAMARLVPARGASEQVRILADRVIASQLDEIAAMQDWLRQRRLPVPDAESSHEHMTHGMVAPMPGMLTAAQMAELEAARGADFDRLFVTLMIQHHQGAIVMVERLFQAPGAAQGGIVFRFASDVHADQSAEIARMVRMLRTLPLAGRE